MLSAGRAGVCCVNQTHRPCPLHSAHAQYHHILCTMQGCKSASIQAAGAARYPHLCRQFDIALAGAATAAGERAQNSSAPCSLLPLLPGSDSEQLHAGYGSIRAIFRGDIDYLEGAGQRCVCCCCTSAGPRLTRPHRLVCSIQTSVSRPLLLCRARASSGRTSSASMSA